MADPNLATNILNGFNAMQAIVNAPRLEAERRAAAITKQAMDAALLADQQERTQQRAQLFPHTLQMAALGPKQGEAQLAKDKTEADKARLELEQSPNDYFKSLMTKTGGGHPAGTAIEMTVQKYGPQWRQPLTDMWVKGQTASGLVPKTKEVTTTTPGAAYTIPSMTTDQSLVSQVPKWAQGVLPPAVGGVQTPQFKDVTIPEMTLHEPDVTTKSQVPLTPQEIVDLAFKQSSPEVEADRLNQESLRNARSARIQAGMGNALKDNPNLTYGQLELTLPLYGLGPEDVAEFMQKGEALETAKGGRSFGLSPEEAHAKFLNTIFSRVAESKMLTTEKLAAIHAQAAIDAKSIAERKLTLSSDIQHAKLKLSADRNDIARLNASISAVNANTGQRRLLISERDQVWKERIAPQLDLSEGRMKAAEAHLTEARAAEGRANGVLNELLALKRSGGMIRNPVSGKDEVVTDGDVNKAEAAANVAQRARTDAATLYSEAQTAFKEIGVQIKAGAQSVGPNAVIRTGATGKAKSLPSIDLSGSSGQLPANVQANLKASQQRARKGVTPSGLAYGIRPLIRKP